MIWQCRVLTAALVLGFASHVGAAEKSQPPSSAADLRYGVTLYHYFQSDYFAALSELQMAKVRGGIKGHGDNPDIIEGGISLAFDMPHKAESLFTRLLDDSHPLAVRNAAWFYLGKLYYLRGEWAQASASLQHITSEIEPVLAGELAALRAHLAIQQNDLDGAVPLLNHLADDSPWAPYVNFNLGTALSRSKEFELAIPYLETAGQLTYITNPDTQQDLLALRDKAETAAGYANLFLGKYGEAIAAFQQVRLNTPFSRQALLGYGWAAQQQENYPLALKPWKALASEPAIFPEAQEARLALPFAYEQLGANGHALLALQTAEDTFSNELQRLDQVLQGVDELQVRQALLRWNAGERPLQDWLALDNEPGVVPPEPYMALLFSDDQFQLQVQSLRELLQLQQRLQQWQGKLALYDDLLNQRQIQRDQRVQAIEAADYPAKIQTLSQQLQHQTETLDTIMATTDVMAFVTGRAQDQWQRVQRGEATLKRMQAAGRNTDEEAAALRRYRGLLLWQASQQYHDQVWRHQQAIAAVASELQQLHEQYHRLQTAVVEAPDVVPFKARISEGETRLAQQLTAVDNQITALETHIRARLRQELLTQRERLQYYQAEARLAIARLYDGAMQPGTNENKTLPDNDQSDDQSNEEAP